MSQGGSSVHISFIRTNHRLQENKGVRTNVDSKALTESLEVELQFDYKKKFRLKS